MTMNNQHRTISRALVAVAAMLGLVACGGGDEATTATTAQADPARAQILRKGNDCIGSCTGGGGTPVPGATNPLPTTAPAPDVLYRESFGPGPEQLRPKGGKGDMRSAFLHTTIGGFWVEWPGSRNTSWIGANGDQSWKFAGADGNPYEMPSPLQPGEGFGGVAYSEVFDVTSPVYPSLLLPVTLPDGRWALSIEALPQGGAFDAYVALGLTDSTVTTSNLTTVGKVALVLRRDAGSPALRWELWSGVGTRSLLASGATDDMTWNRLVLSYDPGTQQLTAAVNDVTVGPFALSLGAVRLAGFEGLGMADNFVIRRLP